MVGLEKGITKEAVRMAWPAVCESFFIALAGMVDSLMVSSMGASAVAAVGLTTQPKFMGLALFFAMNVSVSALVARRRGEKNQRSANQILLVAILFVIVATVVISSACVMWANEIINFCGSAPETHEPAVIYYRIIMGCMIFNVLSMVINAAQRGSGNTMIAMRTNIVSNVVNIIANYLLIQGHLGFPALGIAGAAIATVFGTVIACIMSFASLFRRDGFVSIYYIMEQQIRPALEPVISIIKLGFSVFIEQILMRVGFMSTAMMAAKMGTNALAAHQVGMNILGLTFSFGDGMQVAAVALIGRSLGEGSPDKVKAYGKTCRMIGLGISCVLAVVYFFGGEWLYHLFFAEQEIVDIGVMIIRIMIIIVLFQVSQVIYMGCLRGAGDTTYTAIASTISVTIIRTSASYFFGFVMGLGMAGIWMGILADQISRFLFASIRFKQGKWTKIHI
ncbi:MAG TPA: MATE family efflux transporter [Lachnospiraceae bacterium]|nr:MATE family efflux transporter [Lachnospiraceae bacterium]